MSVAKFTVETDGKVRFNGARRATVLIDRKLGLITVRPYRQHREYTLPLADIAESVVVRCIKAEVAEKKATSGKKPKRFLVSRGLLG